MTPAGNMGGWAAGSQATAAGACAPNGQLSVVATVWGVTTSTQSGPHTAGYAGAGGHQMASNGAAYGPGGGQPPSGYGSGPGGMSHKYAGMASGGRHTQSGGGYATG